MKYTEEEYKEEFGVIWARFRRTSEIKTSVYFDTYVLPDFLKKAGWSYEEHRELRLRTAVEMFKNGELKHPNTPKRPNLN